MLVEFSPKGGYQLTVLLVDGTLAPEMVVVFGDCEHAFAGDVLAAEDVFKEGDDFVVGLGPAKRHDQQCVIFHAK